jgi:hypothetical protein
MLEALVQNVSVTQVALITVACVLLVGLVSRMHESYRISKLGARAPIRPSYAPFGLDTAYRGIVSVLNNRVLEYFEAGR